MAIMEVLDGSHITAEPNLQNTCCVSAFFRRAEGREGGGGGQDWTTAR